jgi:hypothetical protein
MATKLNKRAYEHARKLIDEGQYVLDQRDDWSEHQPTSQQENAFIDAHGFDEYSRWHLGIDGDKRQNTKARYSFPYGDFEKVHRCAVISAESRAAQYEHSDIRAATDHLHGMLDALAQQRAATGSIPVRTPAR